jgi:hypothetical protein
MIAIVTEMEPDPAAVVVPMPDVEPVPIAFVGLCRTLEAGESKQAETGRAFARIGNSFRWGRERGEMSDPVN